LNEILIFCQNFQKCPKLLKSHKSTKIHTKSKYNSNFEPSRNKTNIFPHGTESQLGAKNHIITTGKLLAEDNFLILANIHHLINFETETYSG
jgi:hypothetical protein